VFVCIPPGKAVPKMAYTVSGATLNPTHSLTHSLIAKQYIVTLAFSLLYRGFCFVISTQFFFDERQISGEIVS